MALTEYLDPSEGFEESYEFQGFNISLIVSEERKPSRSVPVPNRIISFLIFKDGSLVREVKGKNYLWHSSIFDQRTKYDLIVDCFDKI